MILLRMITNATNLLTFAAPDARSTTFNIEQNVAPKRAGTRTVLNSKTTFVSRSVVALPLVPNCTETCSSDTEVVRISTSISGSVENQIVVDKMIRDHLYNLSLAYPDAIKGFLNRAGAYAIDTSTE